MSKRGGNPLAGCRIEYQIVLIKLTLLFPHSAAQSLSSISNPCS